MLYASTPVQVPPLEHASPAVWAAFVLALLGWPILLGTAIGALPAIRPLFRGDRTRWFPFWRLTVALLWIEALLVVGLLARGGVGLSEIGAVSPNRYVLIGGAAVVIALVLATLAASGQVASSGPTEHGLVVLPHTRAERLFMVLAIAPSAAICEEIVYRGVVLAMLGSLIGPWPANLIQAALFGFHHGGVRQGILPFLSRAAIGVVFGVIVMYDGTLTPVIALHYVLDAALATRPSRAGAAKLA